jgi:hypothetical protein
MFPCHMVDKQKTECVLTLGRKTGIYFRKYRNFRNMFPFSSKHVKTLFPQVVDNLLRTSLLSSTDLLQVVTTTCYCPAIQQFINKLQVITL